MLINYIRGVAQKVMPALSAHNPARVITALSVHPKGPVELGGLFGLTSEVRSCVPSPEMSIINRYQKIESN